MSARSMLPRGQHRWSCHSRRNTRDGMVLPLVLIVMLLVMTMAAALQIAGWRAARGARTHWDTQRALYLAEAGIVRAISSWPADSVAATAIGTARIHDVTLANGWLTRVSVTRTGPLTAMAHAIASYTRDRSGIPSSALLGDASGIRRAVTRVIRLSPPTVPITAALTVLAPLAWDSAFVDGRDHLASTSASGDDCGPWRDTSSVPAVLSATIASVPAGGGASVSFGAVLQTTAVTLTAMQAAIDSAWTPLLARANTLTLTAAGALPPHSAWHAGVMHGAGGVTLHGANAYVGLLLVDGDLHISGQLQVDGALIVRGAVVADTGALSVRGALVVRDALVHGSRLGRATQIQYKPCLAARAFAAVARPRHAPFDAWNSP